MSISLHACSGIPHAPNQGQKDWCSSHSFLLLHGLTQNSGSLFLQRGTMPRLSAFKNCLPYVQPIALHHVTTDAASASLSLPQLGKNECAVYGGSYLLLKVLWVVWFLSVFHYCPPSLLLQIISRFKVRKGVWVSSVHTALYAPSLPA